MREGITSKPTVFNEPLEQNLRIYQLIRTKGGDN